MRGDEIQAGVRGGVIQITPADGQQEEFRVSRVCLSVKMIYPEKGYRQMCVLHWTCVFEAHEWESETRGPDLKWHRQELSS